MKYKQYMIKKQKTCYMSYIFISSSDYNNGVFV